MIVPTDATDVGGADIAACTGVFAGEIGGAQFGVGVLVGTGVEVRVAAGPGASPALHAAKSSMTPTKSGLSSRLGGIQNSGRYCIIDTLSYILGDGLGCKAMPRLAYIGIPNKIRVPDDSDEC